MKDHTDPADKLISEFYKYQIGEEAFNRFVNPDTKLKRQQMELDIAYKRRQLGMPVHDDQFEYALNEDKPFMSTGLMAAFGNRATQQIPNPGANPKPGTMLHFMGGLGHTGNKYQAVAKSDLRGHVRNLANQGILESLDTTIMDQPTKRRIAKNAKSTTTAAESFLKLLLRGIR